MKKNLIVHEYYKRTFDDVIILVQVNPVDYSGLELIVHPDGKLEKTKMQYDEDIQEDLAVDDFEKCSPLEFNLYLKGLV